MSLFRAHTHTLSLTFSLTPPLTLPLELPRSIFLAISEPLCLFLPLSHAFSYLCLLSLYPSHSLSSPTISFPQSASLFPIFSLSLLSASLSLSLTLPLIPSLLLPLSLTFSLLLFQSLSHTLPLCLTPSPISTPHSSIQNLSDTLDTFLFIYFLPSHILSLYIYICMYIYRSLS